MINPDATASTALASGARAGHALVELDFTGGTAYFSTMAQTKTINGHDYLGLGNLVEVSPITETEDPNQQQVTLTFDIGGSSAMLGAAMAPVETYRGKAVRIYQQFTDGTYQPAGAPILRFTGTMEPARVVRSRDTSTGALSAKVELPCSRTGLGRSRNALGLRLTHAQQQERFPGDMGLEYLQSLVEQPALWLTVEFQKQR